LKWGEAYVRYPVACHHAETICIVSCFPAFCLGHDCWLVQSNWLLFTFM
jgi:hypothetical protein